MMYEIPLILKCRGGCQVRINILSPDPLKVPMRYVRYAKTFGIGGPMDKLEWYDALADVKDAYYTCCIAHRQVMCVKPLRIVSGNETCSDACTHAKSSTCKCKCNGLNHGMEA